MVSEDTPASHVARSQSLDVNEAYELAYTFSFSPTQVNNNIYHDLLYVIIRGGKNI